MTNRELLEKQQKTTVNLPKEEWIKLENIAAANGFSHGGKGSVTKLLSALAKLEVLVVNTPAYLRKSPNPVPTTPRSQKQKPNNDTPSPPYV